MAKTITINNWQNGISESRYTGFEDMRMVDLREAGVLKINKKSYEMADDASTPFSAVPDFLGYGRASSSTYKIFSVGTGQIKYWNTDEWDPVTTTTTPDNTQSGAFYGGSAAKDYLIYVKNGSLCAVDCSDLSMNYNFETDMESTAFYNPSYVASNNRLYIGNNQYVAELYEADGETFDPGASSTYEWNAQKLDLPAGYLISSITELGDYLAVGTKNPYFPIKSVVYLWDKVSSSFEQPIIINTPGGVNQLVTYRGILYIQAGNLGSWYYSLGQVAYKCAEIPEHIRGENTFTSRTNSCCVIDDILYFGLSSSGLSGIWSFDTRLTGAKNQDSSSLIQKARYEHLISSLEDGTNDTVTVGAIIMNTTKGMFIGFEDAENSNYGVDTLNGDNDGRKLYSNSEAYMLSQWYNIGDKKNKRTIENTELQLAKALDTNESVKVYYRTERDGAWGDPYLTMSIGQSDNGNRLTNLERIQWKIVLDANASQPTGPELLSFSFTLN